MPAMPPTLLRSVHAQSRRSQLVSSAVLPRTENVRHVQVKAEPRSNEPSSWSTSPKLEHPQDSESNPLSFTATVKSEALSTDVSMHDVKPELGDVKPSFNEFEDDVKPKFEAVKLESEPPIPVRTGPQLIGHLPRAEDAAMRTFEKIPENHYQYSTLGRSREALESMT
jgi:hypothetical protein